MSAPGSAAGLLHGVTVVDRGQGMPAALLSFLLRQLGATVIRELPLDDDPFVSVYPAYRTWREGDLAAAAGAGADPLAGADVCIVGGEDWPGLTRTGAAAVGEGHPRLITLDITAYPAELGRDGDPGVDVLIQAAAGLCSEQRADRPALFAIQPSNFGSALRGAIGILAALVEREKSGRGQLVRTSLFEGALTWLVPMWFRTEHRNPNAHAPLGVRPLVFECSDGRYVHLSFSSRGASSRAYKALGIDDPAVVNYEGPALYGTTKDDFFGDIDRIIPYVRRHTSAWMLEAMTRADVAISLIRAPGECWDDPQVEVNGLLATSKAGVRHVARPIQSEPGEPHVAGAGSRIAGTGEGPLGGIRVIDLGLNVAMPAGARFLGELGAEVIKVESLDPPRGPTWDPINAGKLCLRADLKSSGGSEVVGRLCADAALVMANFRPGVLERLGFGPADLAARFPGISLIQSPGFGATGPQAMEPAFDMTLQASTGLQIRAGGEGNLPVWIPTFVIDVCGGLLNAVAGLACLYHHARTGAGSVAQVPLLNAAIYLLSELVQNAAGEFAGAPSVNRAQTGFHPAEAMYRTADGWLALAARDPAAVRTLAAALGLAEIAALPRERWGEAEGEQIAAALARLPQDEALHRLKAAGVWAEACTSAATSGLLRDPRLHDAGILSRSTYPEVGEVIQLGRMVHFSRSAITGDLRPVVPGQDTREVLGRLGYDAAEVERLFADRAVS